MTEPITEINCADVGSRPIIVQFQNSCLKDGEEQHLKSSIFIKKRKKTTAVVASKEILYMGEIQREENAYNNFLLVRNRKTGKVRLIAVDSAILSPQLQKKPSDEIDASINTSTVRDLHKQFGSKRIKRITEQRERMQLDIETVREQLEETVAGVKLDETDTFKTKVEENDSAYRPAINRDAAKREQVYLLNDLVPEDVLNSLEEEANAVLESEDLSSLQLNPYIEDCLNKLSNSTTNINTVQLLLYINYMIKFVLAPVRMLTKKYILCESSKAVNDHILNMFTLASNTGRTRPISMKDKTVCYILVLTMICLNYEIECEPLSKALKIGVKKIQELGRILAFSSNGKSSKSLILKVPLPPPLSLSPKKRKK